MVSGIIVVSLLMYAAYAKLASLLEQAAPRVDRLVASTAELQHKSELTARRTEALRMSVSDLKSEVASIQSTRVAAFVFGLPRRPNTRDTPNWDENSAFPFVGHGVQKVERKGTGDYYVYLEERTNNMATTVIVTSVKGYSVQVGNFGKKIRLVVADREGKAVDDNFSLVVWEKK